MKKGLVYKKDLFSGTIWEDENGYHFKYDNDYLEHKIYYICKQKDCRNKCSR